MKKTNSTTKFIAALAMSAVLAFPTLALTGCGGSSDSSSGGSTTTQSQSADTSSSDSSSTDSTASDTSSADSSESTSSTASAQSSSDISLDTVEAAMTSAYMGVNQDSGEGYYMAMNDDGSLGMLAVLNTNNGADNATNASFVGEGTVNGNNYVITDYASGDWIGFDVIDNGDGTYTLDLGEKYGKATVTQVDVSEVFNAFKTIDKYTTAVN